MSDEKKPTNKRLGRKKADDSNVTFIEYKHEADQHLNKITETEHLSEKDKQVIKLVVCNKFKYAEAGVMVGYTPKTASSYVSKIINTLGGRKYVDYLYQLQFEAEDELVLRWKKEMVNLAFTDRTQIINKITQGNLWLIPFQEWPEDVRTCVKGVKKHQNGSIEVMFESKTQALEALGRHLGVYLKDNTQKPAKDESVVFYLPDNNREIKEKQDS